MNMHSYIVVMRTSAATTQQSSWVRLCGNRPGKFSHGVYPLRLLSQLAVQLINPICNHPQHCHPTFADHDTRQEVDGKWTYSCAAGQRIIEPTTIVIPRVVTSRITFMSSATAAQIAREAKGIHQGLKELLKTQNPWDKEVEFNRKK
ncbi:hypothetical protein EDD16DRAFT_1198631 [Pisolithus croceorrhizus]|nr:hypothetical protein EDD16DRAFT_1198631 [Pisolithus croceorrhizus]